MRSLIERLSKRCYTLYVQNICCYNFGERKSPMIKSYRDKKTREFAEGKKSKKFDSFRRQAEKRLEVLDAAPSLESLMALPSNRFEALHGYRSGQYSIRINRRWRICFLWPEADSGPSDVEIVDYH